MLKEFGGSVSAFVHRSLKRLFIFWVGNIVGTVGSNLNLATMIEKKELESAEDQRLLIQRVINIVALILVGPAIIRNHKVNINVCLSS